MTAIRMTTLTLTLLLGAIGALAQDRMHTTIPFDFQVGKTVMPSGAYRIAIESNGLVRLGRSDGSATILFATNAGERNRRKAGEDSKLSFRRYDGRAFLAEIWRGDYGTGLALRQGRVENEAARNAGMIEVASVIAR